MPCLATVLEELLEATGASRVTLRRDVDAQSPFPVVEEALAPGVGSLRGEMTVHLPTQPVVREIQRGNQVVQDDCANAYDEPAFQAMLPDLVPPEELMAMVALGIYSWNGGRIIGPLLGSVLVLTVGPAWTIGFNAFSFVVMAIAVALLRRPFRPHGADDHRRGPRR